MRSVWIFIFLLTFCALLSDAGSKWKSKSKYKYRGGGYYTRRAGLSSGQKRLLFASAGALAGIYIGSRMRPRVHLRSYGDLDNYEVCEGSRIEVTDGFTRNYRYFLCPDDPNQMFERHCCWDSSRNTGFCCSYDMKLNEHYQRKSIFGGVFGGLTLLVLVGLLVYCCCCRQRRSKPMAQPTVYTTDPIVTPNPIYKPDPHVPPYNPGCPYPPTNPNPYPAAPPPASVAPYPVNPPPPSHVNPVPVVGPQPGSGWGGIAMNTVPNQSPNTLPPPYPGIGPRDQQQPSAPFDYKT